MPKLIAWFVDNPVAANLLMSIQRLGAIGAQRFTQGRVPKRRCARRHGHRPHLGAAPAEVETGVCARIEESIDGIENIVKVKTTAAEGQCSVAVELEMDVDKAKALDDIKLSQCHLYLLQIRSLQLFRRSLCAALWLK